MALEEDSMRHIHLLGETSIALCVLPTIAWNCHTKTTHLLERQVSEPQSCDHWSINILSTVRLMLAAFFPYYSSTTGQPGHW